MEFRNGENRNDEEDGIKGKTRAVKPPEEQIVVLDIAEAHLLKRVQGMVQVVHGAANKERRDGEDDDVDALKDDE